MPDEVFTGDIGATTVAQAKDWLRLRAKKGARCPCCKQYVKIYRRALGAPMSRWLIWLVRTWEQNDKQLPGVRFAFDRRFEEGTSAGHWVDIRQSPVRGGDYAKLVHWGLIEQKPNLNEKKNGAKDTKDSGLWRPTYKGLDFAHGRSKVPSHVHLYDNIKISVTGAEEPLVTIMQTLGKKYSYSELMSAPVRVEVPV